MWLVVEDDLKSMYPKYPHGGSVTLWCYARNETEAENICKQKRTLKTSKGQNIDENEWNVDQVYQKLLVKHGAT